MESQFEYLLDRVRNAAIETNPFPHIYLRGFLSEADFKHVTQSSDVRLPVVKTLDDLFDTLDKVGYKAIAFPGCTKSRAEYERWVRESQLPAKTHKACESQGMALRLQQAEDDLVRSLDEFFHSPELQETFRTKFGIEAPTTIEAGIQKYLHGYEISPHPDIRRKALTWMLNINPATDSESLDIHTHYLVFNPEWAFISAFWEHNRDIETCWVPWSWCSTIKQQIENNSIVIFSPRWNTIHGIRTRYDHLVTQRTQFYGNLWYESVELPHGPQFEDFAYLVDTAKRGVTLRDHFHSTRRIAKTKVKKVLHRR
jgi:hypothetical protein